MNASPFTSKLNHSRLIVIIVLAVLACFLPTLNNGFVNWDDEITDIDNYDYRGLSFHHLSWMFTSSINNGLYIPLTYLTLCFDYILWEMNPAGYHLTNLLIHCSNSILFYFLILIFLKRSHTDSSDDSPEIRIGAFIGALFFAVHPLRVESVAWLTQRRDVLSAFFYLLTVISYLQLHGSKNGTILKNKWFYISLFCFTCSLLSKPWAITLPVIFIVLDIYSARSSDLNIKLSRLLKLLLIQKIPYFLLSFSFVALTALAQSKTGAVESVAQHGIIARCMQAVYGLSFYLWKTIIPRNLSPLYLMEHPFNPFELKYIFCAFFVLSITLALIGMRHRWPWALTAWVCYAVILSPVLGFFQSGPEMVADRFSYISCLPFGILVGAGIARMWLVRQKWSVFLRRFVISAVAGCLSVFSILTVHQIHIWQDNHALWNHVLKLDPRNYIAHNNFGNILKDENRVKEAVTHYEKALRVHPDLWLAHNNVGTAFAQQGEVEKAIFHYTESIRINPRASETYFNLGNIFADQGRLEQSVAYYSIALQIEPDNAAIHNNLGIARMRQGQIRKAYDHFYRALQIRPNFEDALNNMDRILEIIGVPKKIK